MILAKDRYGRIGRQVPGPGFQAQVARPGPAIRRGNTYLSMGQIATDDAYWRAHENEARAYQHAQRVANGLKAKAQAVQAQRSAAVATRYQQLAKVDPMNEALRSYYARRGMMGESVQVAANLVATKGAPSAPVSLSWGGGYIAAPAGTGKTPPADFSSSGGNVALVDGDPMTGGAQWRADWRQHWITGNPLTRDAVVGPAITDFDRIVKGVDVNQTNVVAGGTILGRVDGQNVPSMGRIPRRFRMRGMGQDDSLDTLEPLPADDLTAEFDALPDSGAAAPPMPEEQPSWWDKFTSSLTSQKNIDSATASLTSSALKSITPTTGTRSTTTVIAAPGVRLPAGTTTVVQAGIPKWAIYASLALVATGTAFAILKRRG